MNATDDSSEPSPPLTEDTASEVRIQELEAELNHVQRLAEIGQVMSALVHEISQPLSAISNYVGAGRRLVTAGHFDAIQGSFERIGDQTARAQSIIRRIRAFVKNDAIQMRVENLSRVIEDAIGLARSSAKDPDLRFRMHVDPTDLKVEIDKVQVQQVLFNLLRNGTDATRGQSNRELVVAAGASDAGMVEISVRDNGPGLSADARETLFQPFVTTKPEGMGIGLSVCWTIVASHGGRIWAEETPGGGADFRFTVPGVSA